jgi:hypothetical protein
MLQGIDVGDDAAEQVAAAVLHQAGRGQRLNGLVEPDPQPGQQPEGDLVGGQSLQVAKNAPG